MVKNFNEMSNVGRAKYVVNFHDRVKTHRDGSAFYAIAIFRNKRKLAAFVRTLRADGYLSGYTVPEVSPVSEG